MNTKPTEFKFFKTMAIYGAYKHTMKKLTKPVRVKSRSRAQNNGGSLLTTIVALLVIGLILK